MEVRSSRRLRTLVTQMALLRPVRYELARALIPSWPGAPRSNQRIAKGKPIVAAVDSQALISIVVAAFLSNKVVEVTLNKRINCSGSLENATMRVKTLQISLPVQ
jgi:hypothetical protein